MKKQFVLSGGGARGYAHLGVVKALGENNIYPAAISGTSAGAIAGAFLANGFTPDEIAEILADKIRLRMFGWNSLRQGLISFKKVGDYIEQNLRYRTFEELPIPLYISATSFVDGRQKIFNKGSIMEALTASCAIPAIFPALELDNVPYVDGGLSNNLPVEPFLLKKKDVISIHVNPIRDLSEKRGIMEIVERSFHLSFAEVVRQSAYGCHMFIEPKELVHYSLFDLRRSRDIIDVGYKYGIQYLVENPHLLRNETFVEKLKQKWRSLATQNP